MRLSSTPRDRVVLVIAGFLVLFCIAAAAANLLKQEPIRASVTTQSPSVSNGGDIYATGDQIVAACGQPASRWKDSAGHGKTLGIGEHLWYPNVPAEILLSEYPNDPKPQMRPETFYGAAPSVKGERMYDYRVLAKLMPCIAPWANVLADTEDRMLQGK